MATNLSIPGTEAYNRNIFFEKLAKEVITIFKTQKKYKKMEHAIEDAVYEMIVRYLKQEDTLDCKDPKAWVIKGTYRLLISQYRRHKRSLQYASDAKRSNDHYFDPFYQIDQIDISLMRKILMNHIHRLPTRCRQVIEAHLAEATDEEIATQLGITVETVRSHKSHAHQHIIQHLQNSAESRNLVKPKTKNHEPKR